MQEKYAISQYPFVVIFRNGQLFPYEGPAEKAGVSGKSPYHVLLLTHVRGNQVEVPLFMLSVLCSFKDWVICASLNS